MCSISWILLFAKRCQSLRTPDTVVSNLIVFVQDKGELLPILTTFLGNCVICDILWIRGSCHNFFSYNAHSQIQKTRYWSCVCMFTASEPSKLVLDVLGQSSNRSLHDVSLETNTFARTFAYQDGIQKCRLARLLQAHQSNLSFLLKERILYPVNTHFLHSNMDASRTTPEMEHSYLSQTPLQAQSIDGIWRRLFQLWQNNRPLGSLLILYSEEVVMKLMKRYRYIFFFNKTKIRQALSYIYGK